MIPHVNLCTSAQLLDNTSLHQEGANQQVKDTQDCGKEGGGEQWGQEAGGEELGEEGGGEV